MRAAGTQRRPRPATPIPPPAENEQWRERRRAERAAKQAHRADDEAALRVEREASDDSVSAIEPENLSTSGDDTPESLPVTDYVGETSTVEAEPQPQAQDEVTVESHAETSEAAITTGPGDRSPEEAARRRRRRGRRRRGRRRPGADATGETATSEGSPPGEPTARDPESNEPFPDSESGEFDANDE